MKIKTLFRNKCCPLCKSHLLKNKDGLLVYETKKCLSCNIVLDKRKYIGNTYYSHGLYKTMWDQSGTEFILSWEDDTIFGAHKITCWLAKQKKIHTQLDFAPPFDITYDRLQKLITLS
jgi:hypothetical protein